MPGPERGAGALLDGRWRLEARLAGWGAGECWRAVDAQRGRGTVVVKVLPAPSLRRAERLAALAVLGDRLGRLRHPAVLPVIEVNTSGPQPYAVLEHWESEGLGDWLASSKARAERPSLETVASMADAVLGAVGAGHRQRAPGSLVHGGLHHDAVRVRVAGAPAEARVLDFGLAADRDAPALTDLTDGGATEYAAPEHAREPALRTPSTDVFAAAVLVVRMLAPDAARPAGHRSWAHFVGQREAGVHAVLAALRPDVPDGIWAALAQAMARRPEARPQDAERLREALRATGWVRPPEADDLVDLSAPVVAVAMPALPAPPRPATPRLDGSAVRPRNRTVGLEMSDFGAAAADVSLDDASTTRQDIVLPPEPPMALAAAGETVAVRLPSAMAMMATLAEAERTAPAPFDTTLVPDAVSARAPAISPVTPATSPPIAASPSDWTSAPWVPSSVAPAELTALTEAPAPVFVSDKTIPLSMDSVPPEVAAALAAYASPPAAVPWAPPVPSAPPPAQGFAPSAPPSSGRAAAARAPWSNVWVLVVIGAVAA